MSIAKLITSTHFCLKFLGIRAILSSRLNKYALDFYLALKLRTSQDMIVENTLYLRQVGQNRQLDSGNKNTRVQLEIIFFIVSTVIISFIIRIHIRSISRQFYTYMINIVR